MQERDHLFCFDCFLVCDINNVSVTPKSTPAFMRRCMLWGIPDLAEKKLMCFLTQPRFIAPPPKPEAANFPTPAGRATFQLSCHCSVFTAGLVHLLTSWQHDLSHDKCFAHTGELRTWGDWCGTCRHQTTPDQCTPCLWSVCLFVCFIVKWFATQCI